MEQPGTRSSRTPTATMARSWRLPSPRCSRYWVERVVLIPDSAKLKVRTVEAVTPSLLLTAYKGLAKAIAWDGEGATCLMEISVVGANSDVEARKVALSVAGSSLTKAAIYGHDPNWGRIAAAAGYSGRCRLWASWGLPM